MVTSFKTTPLLSLGLVASLLLVRNVYSFSPPDASCVRSNSRRSSMTQLHQNQVSRRHALVSTATVIGVSSVGLSPAQARLEAVNNPKLLPTEPGLNVIQTEKFLTAGQVRRMDQLLSALERDTGWRVRVLCQSYPNTPGLAIRDYWSLGKDDQKDDRYVVLVVDQFGGKGNVLNFNVGEGTKLALPNVFWTRLQGKYGNTFYVRDNGIDLAVTNAIDAIVSCLRSEEQFCVQVPETAPSLKSMGMV